MRRGWRVHARGSVSSRADHLVQHPSGRVQGSRHAGDGRYDVRGQHGLLRGRLRRVHREPELRASERLQHGPHGLLERRVRVRRSEDESGGRNSLWRGRRWNDLRQRRVRLSHRNASLQRLVRAEHGCRDVRQLVHAVPNARGLDRVVQRGRHMLVHVCWCGRCVQHPRGYVQRCGVRVQRGRHLRGGTALRERRMHLRQGILQPRLLRGYNVSRSRGHGICA